jgi:hypothetical protein
MLQARTSQSKSRMIRVDHRSIPRTPRMSQLTGRSPSSSMIAADDAVVIRKLDLDPLLGDDGAETSAVTRLYPGAIAVAPLQ